MSLRLSFPTHQPCADQTTLIAHSASVAQQFADGVFDRNSFEPTDAVRYCFLHVSLYRKYITEICAAQQGLIGHRTETEPADTRGSINWSNLWKTISSAVRKYSHDKKWEATYNEQYWHLPLRILPPNELLAEDRALAGECLEIMDSIESQGDADRLERNKRLPIFPDELVAALGLFTLPEDVSGYPRLARLFYDQAPAIHAKEENTA